MGASNNITSICLPIRYGYYMEHLLPIANRDWGKSRAGPVAGKNRERHAYPRRLGQDERKKLADGEEVPACNINYYRGRVLIKKKEGHFMSTNYTKVKGNLSWRL